MSTKGLKKFQLKPPVMIRKSANTAGGAASLTWNYYKTSGEKEIQFTFGGLESWRRSFTFNSNDMNVMLILFIK